MIPLLLIRLGDGAAVTAPEGASLDYTIVGLRLNWVAGGGRLHYTMTVGRCHYDA